MKFLKSVSILIAVIAVFSSCSDDDVSFAFDNVSAPSEVRAVFDVAQDESGLVTVTPSGIAASSFEIYFGDTENEEPTIVSPGSSAEHIYEEGEYIGRVVAIGSTGLTSEFSQLVMISFAAPENLEIAIVQDPATPFDVTVSASADSATIFDVFFGDVEDEEPTMIMIGDSATHTYESPGQYTVRVVARGAGNRTIEDTALVTISDGNESLSIPIDFESLAIDFAFTDFGGAVTQATDNPNSSGINTSGRVGETLKTAGAETFAGSFLNLEDPIDFSENKIFKVKVFSPKSGIIVKLKVENQDNPDISFEIDVVNTIANDWEELSFDFSVIDINNDYNRVIIFFDFGLVGDDSTYLFDDIILESGGVDQPIVNLPIDFESSDIEYIWTGFGSDTFGAIPAAVVSNPDPSGINTSANVVEIQKTPGAQVWAGASLPLSGAIDFSEGTTISIKVWSPRAGVPILFKTEDINSAPNGDGNPSVFVEVEATTTVANAWEELSFDLSSIATFDASISYQNAIIFPDFGNMGAGEAFYFDDIEIASDGMEIPSIQFPIDFDIAELDYIWTGFGSDTFGPIPAAVVTNPDISGINTTANALEIQKLAGAQVWAGASMPLDSAVDFSNGTTVKIQVWSPRAGVPVLFKMEDPTSPLDANQNPSVFVEIQAITTVANAWEELSFDLTSFASFDTSILYRNVIIFPDFGNMGAGEAFYFDNLILTN